MCLTVKRSFVKNPIPSAYCWKVMETSDNKNWTTLYRETPISKTGILVPKTNPKRKNEFPTYIDVHGGYIHACTTENKANILLKIEKHCHYKLKVFKAIATDIIAIGWNDDLICKALYIPELDLT